MSYNIYDEHGNKRGEIKSKDEVIEENVKAGFSMGVIVAGFIAVLAAMIPLAIWIGLLQAVEEGERFPLFILIPVIIMTIMKSAMIKDEGMRSEWNAFWRIAATTATAGFACCMLYFLWAQSASGIVEYGIDIELIGEMAVYSMLSAILPAAISTYVLYKSNKKSQ